MARLTSNNDFGNQGLLYQIDQIIAHTSYMKSEYLMDNRAKEYFDWILSKMQIIRMLTLKNPRFQFQIIQDDMDNAYQKGQGLISGYIINIDIEKNSKYLPANLKYRISELKLTA